MSYSNPLEQVLLASLSPERAAGVTTFLHFLATIGQERAVQRELIQQEQIKTAIAESTLGFAVDGVTAQVVEQELRLERLQLEARRDAMLFAFEIIEAQKAMIAKGHSVELWNVPRAMAYLRGEEQLEPNTRKLQQLDLTIEVVDEGNNVSSS